MRITYPIFFFLVLSSLSWAAAPHAAGPGGRGQAPAGPQPKDTSCADARSGAAAARADAIQTLIDGKKVSRQTLAQLRSDEAYAKACRWFSETGQVVTPEQIEAVTKKLTLSFGALQADLAKDAARASVKNEKLVKSLLESVAKWEIETSETAQLRSDLIRLAQELQSERIKPEIPIQHEIKAWGPPGTKKFNESLEKQIEKTMAEYKQSGDFDKDVAARLEKLVTSTVAIAKHGADLATVAKPKFNVADTLKVRDAKLAWQQEQTELEKHRKTPVAGAATAGEKEIKFAIEKIDAELKRAKTFPDAAFLRGLAATEGTSAAAVYRAVDQIRAARVELLHDKYATVTGKVIKAGDIAQRRNAAIEAMKQLEASGKAKFDRQPNSDSFKESDVDAVAEYLK